MAPATGTSPAVEKSAQATVNIAPDGDVVFVVGPAERRLRVHSLVVKTASAVLNAMLRPNFMEGQQLASTGSAEIALPDDDDKAMEIIFSVVHGRNDAVPKQLDPTQLLQVAIATDKYDCFLSLAFAIPVWLNVKEGPREDDFWFNEKGCGLLRWRQVSSAHGTPLQR